MVFRRRDKPSILRRSREILFPRRGYRRGIEYLKHRVRRIPDTPHRIALGFACGAMASFTPMFGFHFILSVVLARLLGGNVIASLFGTAVGNPLTFPIIASFSLDLGHRILGFGASGNNFALVADAFKEFATGLWQVVLSVFGLATPDLEKLTGLFRDVILPYLVGGFVPGLIAAVASYYLLRPLVAAYQTRRRSKLMARTRQRIAAKRAKNLSVPRGYASSKSGRNVEEAGG